MKNLSRLVLVVSIFCITTSGSAIAGWSVVESGTESMLRGVWGSSSNDVFAVGDHIILHYDGSTWSEMEHATTTWFWDVWGNSGTDVFAVGLYGCSLHYDGISWSYLNGISSFADLLSVWGTTGNNVYATCYVDHAGGGGGAVYHYDGSAWSWIRHEELVFFSSVWGSATDNIIFSATQVDPFGMGWYTGAISYYNGVDWFDEFFGSPPLLDAWGNSENDVFAVGEEGTIIHFDGTSWSSTGSPTSYDLNGVWGNSGSDVFAVGDYGTILYYEGSDWSVMNSGTTENLFEVWGSSGANVFTVGDNGTILQYDGIPEEEDNCPEIYNPDQADSDGDCIGDVCDEYPDIYDTSLRDSDSDGKGDACDNCPEDHNPNQEDTSPLGGNNCGDACECEGDFEPDGDVDGTDAVKFKEDFFRKDCDTNPPCNGDFECDGDIDGTDAVKFKADFFRKDCPSCGGWPCVYE